MPSNLRSESVGDQVALAAVPKLPLTMQLSATKIALKEHPHLRWYYSEEGTDGHPGLPDMQGTVGTHH